MEAVVARVTTSGGWYAYISDVKGIAGISMMRVKLKALAPTPVYGG